jgi:uncharacterized membrane protein
MSRRSKHHEAHKPTDGATTASDHAQEHPFTHRVALPPEKFFRWRGGEITRLEAFCDVVFGFALTLLVVSLEVPHSYSELIADMRGFVPFAICFSQLVMIWLTHYKFSRRYGLEDSYTVFLNMVLLFLVLLYVYPLKFVFTLVFSQLTGAVAGSDLTLHQASVMMEIYAIGFASVFLLFTLMYLHAYRLRDTLELTAIEALETQASMQSCAILSLIGFISLMTAVRRPEWAGWLFLFIGPALTIHGMIAGRRTRLLTEKAGMS